MPAEIRSFHDPLEPAIYWDSSFPIAVHDVTHMMERYRLLPTDACHIAVAQSHGINAFATLDPDFSAVNGIVLFMP